MTCLILVQSTAMSVVGFWGLVLLTLHKAHFGGSQILPFNEPDVPFPPARPTFQNLAAICLDGNGRPRYTSSFFPVSGVSHFRRRGDAINRLESWYSLCCNGHVAQEPSVILCCAQQAWKQALGQFCAEEYSTMTSPYDCCRKQGDDRWKCFDSELPNPSYSPKPGYTAPRVPQEEGFIFNPNAC